ncbi:MAG: SufD family Fe-S cluster assembly protein, partial [Clostridia bacterium]|nr:SufD family Fe-S cluster assembly protein [Clostridia bacterium]
MLKLDEMQKKLLEEVADLHAVPEGAYNIRSNGKSIGRSSSAHIHITSKEDGSGIVVQIDPETKKESVHIPVVMTQTGLKEVVYNDFYIGKDADVVIVAGCGIDNCGNQDAQHDGIHRFFVDPGAKVKYVEKHYGSGEGKGKRILNPVTEVFLSENAYMEMEMVQIKGVDAVVLGVLVAAVVDTAARHDHHVGVPADVEIVVYGLLQAGLSQDHGDVNAFVFGARLDADIDAG